MKMWCIKNALRVAMGVTFLAWLGKPALASDNLLIYSDQLNNGWGDWGWVTHYRTNSPVHVGPFPGCHIDGDRLLAAI